MQQDDAIPTLASKEISDRGSRRTGRKWRKKGNQRAMGKENHEGLELAHGRTIRHHGGHLRHLQLSLGHGYCQNWMQGKEWTQEGQKHHWV